MNRTAIVLAAIEEELRVRVDVAELSHHDFGDPLFRAVVVDECAVVCGDGSGDHQHHYSRTESDSLRHVQILLGWLVMATFGAISRQCRFLPGRE